MTSEILVLTTLVVVLVLALALLAGSLALLITAGKAGETERAGLQQAFHELDRQWRVERWIYRHHRPFGLLVVLAALVSIWQLLKLDLLNALAASNAWGVSACVLLGGQALNLAAGIVIVTRPSLLKPLETLSNRWHRIGDFESGRSIPPRIKALLLLLVAVVVALTSGLLLVCTVAY
ncbi:hypothetical protein [Wenzhouxiangella sp. EGI_FJ10305]|uniref:hypothetical protein n=1 Tax=Wenzhouxiangella sp. EGI_FJ10305 TaxID=3243768 RepID=UPI0035DF1D14